MRLKEIDSGTIFDTAKIQLLVKLQNRIIVEDVWEVNGTLKGFIFGMWSNPSVSFERNE